MVFLYRGLALCFLLILPAWMWAQMPESIRVLDTEATVEQRKLLNCNDAGTIQNPMFIGSAQSNDVQFLCFGDSIQVIHNGDFDLSGDPIAATAPGVGYAIYSCPPTIEGMDIMTILTDPCLVTDPMPFNDLWAVTDQPNGNAIFNNILFQPGNTTVMDFYNNGDPVLIYYAPITIDDFDNNNFENGGNCVDVGVDQAFPLVYLNPVELTINEEQLDCNCDGDIELSFSGGLPEYNPSESYTLSVTETNTGAPVVLGENILAGNNYFLDIPGPGDYELLVEDGVSCSYFSIESFCQNTQIDLEIPEVDADLGDEICLPVTVTCLENVSAFQFTLQFDDAVLRFDTIFSDFLDITQGNYNLFMNNQVIVTWDSPSLDSIPFMDGDIFVYLCFEVIGSTGGSDVNLVDVEFASADGNGGFDVFLDNDINVNQGRVNVDQQIQIIDTLIQDIITCPDDTTGSINITVNGGVPPYRYLWQTPIGSSMQEDLMNIPAGNYSVTILDSEIPPNELIANFVVSSPSDFMLDLEGIDPLCFDSLNGCLIVNSVTGGTPPYSWTWRDATNNAVGTSNEDTICGIGRGLYTLELTDANGCQDDQNILLQANAITAILNTNESVLRESCDPGMDGRLVLNISGGDISQTGAYGISWSNGDENVSEIANLSSGNYSVTITDDNGCSLVRSGLFISPARAPFITTFDSVSISCPGGSDGVLIARFDSPASPISRIDWSNGDAAGPGTTIDSITGLSSGWYYVTVTAEDGCQGVDSAFLGEPQGIQYDVEQINPECNGYRTGSIRIIPRPNADTMNIIVEWNTGDTGYLLDSLPAGRYFANFTDTINGCAIDSFVLQITQPPGMSLTFSNTSPANCFNDCDGMATLTVTGGNAPGGLYDIRWNDNDQVDGNTDVSTNIRLCPGMNYVTVTDEAGCIQLDSIEIGSPPELRLNQEGTNNISPSCTGLCDGEVRLAIEGGQAPYLVRWFDNSTGLIKDNLCAGTYQLTIEDNNGCTRTATATLVDPDSFFVFTDITSSNLALNCSGDTDGRIVIATSALNTNGLTYQWSPNVSTGPEASNLSPGNYGITVTTLNGCMDSTRAIVSGVPEIEYSLSGIEQPACFGQPSTFTVSDAMGGNGGPYSYKILEEGIELDLGDSVSLFAGSYTLSVVDRDGCEIDSVLVIGQPQELLVNIPHDTIIRGQELLLAEMGEDKSIVVQYTPLTTRLGRINWILEDPSGTARYNQDSSRITSQFLSSQLVIAEVIDENGCIGRDEIFIRVDRDRNVFIPNAFSPNADNQNDLFAVYTGPGVLNIKSFRVFNRWGEQVYFIENIDPLVFNSNAVGWDGRFQGKELNPAVFVYLIEVEFIDGELLLYRGDVTLTK